MYRTSAGMACTAPFSPYTMNDSPHGAAASPYAANISPTAPPSNSTIAKA